MARIFALLSVLLSWAAPVHAQGQFQKYNGIGNASSLTTIEDISFWYDVTLNTGLLLGEPIISTRFRWLINVPNSQATIPAMGIGEDTYESVPLSVLGSQAPSKVRIYNVKVEYQFATSAGTLYHLADAGDPAVGDGRSWSFNVPDAPDWDRMFYRSALQTPSHSRSFVSAQTAKSAFKDSVRLVNARVLDAEISLYDLHNWYMRGTDASEAIATEKALEDIRIGVFRNFGYSVRGVNAAFFPPSKALNSVRSGIGELPSMMSNYLKEAGPRLQKLMQLPKELQNGEDSWIYEIAVKDARKTLERSLERAGNYRSPDKDPRRFRRGSKPPAFTNSVSASAARDFERGEVKVWTMHFYLDSGGGGPKIGEQHNLGHRLYKKGTVLSQYQMTTKGRGCTVYTSKFLLFMEGYLDADDIAKYSKSTDIFTDLTKARQRLKTHISNRSYPMVDITRAKTNTCADPKSNVPRP